VDTNNQCIQWCSQGLQAGLDCWRNGYLRTYLYFDNSFLRENYYRHLPIGLATGILWYAHRTPSTIYAMAKAIIQLCPHSPMAPLPDFQSLSPEQKEGIYQHIEEKLKPSSVNHMLNWHHYWNQRHPRMLLNHTSVRDASNQMKPKSTYWNADR
jgi:hypothetical protein